VSPSGTPAFARRAGCRGVAEWCLRDSLSVRVDAQESQGLSTGLGDEGGFAPDVAGTAARWTIGSASSRRGSSAPTCAGPRRGGHRVHTDGTGYSFEGSTRTAEQMDGVLRPKLLDSYAAVSIEDPLSEDDWQGWADLTSSIVTACKSWADDIFVTNPGGSRRHRKGRRQRAAGQGEPNRHAD